MVSALDTVATGMVLTNAFSDGDNKIACLKFTLTELIDHRNWSEHRLALYGVYA
ncbi:MAG: hypothetical protein KBA75_04220 [Alphaproteobacteria bacterium]|nr:hypothetical protein [Alphaproteobacteria bacterium]